LDERFYLGLANELLAKFRRVSSFVSHGPSIGTYHEEALRTVLRLMLPDRFSLRTGFVFHPDNGASQQGDILIVDEMEAGAYYFREGNFAVVDQAALVCVIEVKASLDQSSFKKALEGLASYQRVTAKPHHPVTALFAFHSASFTPARLGDWYKSIKIPDEIPYYPWGIYALNRGLISLRYPSSSEWGHYVPVGEAKRGPKVKSLSLFLQTIRKAVLSRAGSKDNPFTLAMLDGLSWSAQFFRFGSGMRQSAD
jgi:hypothetical protein